MKENLVETIVSKTSNLRKQNHYRLLCNEMAHINSYRTVEMNHVNFDCHDFLFTYSYDEQLMSS
jgi:hypothetical protein